MAFAQTRNRIIPGAVATVGVSDRVAFLRKTYATLGIALLAWAGLTFVIFRFATEFSYKWSSWAFSGYHWLAVIGLFVVTGMIAEKLARNSTSRGLQLLGLAIEVGAWSMLLQPMIWVLFIKFGQSTTTSPMAILGQAIMITMTIFVGLTATVFVTKKDFSFMRSALTIATFAAFGVIVASLIFGFSLGALFCGAMILLMAGYILFQTSMIMKEFPPTAHVAAALMLFGTVATLFWYVLQLLISLRGND